jgi:Protein of unknown function (DUF2795)
MLSSSSSSTNKEENQSSSSNNKDKQQVPTEYNQEQTLRTVRKQDKVPGQSRSKTINDFPYAAVIGRTLKSLEFPAHKDKILQYLQQKQSTNPESNEVLSILQQIEEREYSNVADITKATGLVEEQ